MKIAIVGAGAMGSRYGYMLHEAGNEVMLIDSWKDHVDTICYLKMLKKFQS